MSLSIYSTSTTVNNISKLRSDLEHNSLLSPIFDYILQDSGELKVYFTRDLTQTEVDEVSGIVNNFVEVDVLDETTVDTASRQSDGIALFQKIYSDLALNSTFATVDASIAGYDDLIKLRCMLKDGSGKTALRYLVRSMASSFPSDQTERFRLWIREYCIKHPEPEHANFTLEQHNGLLDLVEQLENI